MSPSKVAKLVFIFMMVMVVVEAQEGAPNQAPADPFCWFTCMGPCIEGKQTFLTCFIQCLPKCSEGAPPIDKITSQGEVQN